MIPPITTIIMDYGPFLGYYAQFIRSLWLGVPHITSTLAFHLSFGLMYQSDEVISVDWLLDVCHGTTVTTTGTLGNGESAVGSGVLIELGENIQVITSPKSPMTPSSR